MGTVWAGEGEGEENEQIQQGQAEEIRGPSENVEGEENSLNPSSLTVSWWVPLF